MDEFKYTIKSCKHDGRLHRMWLNNWLVPAHLLDPDHAAQSMSVLVNEGAPVIEADRGEWINKTPAVCFFIPGQWYNIVALLESAGVSYYCNLASPFYSAGQMFVYTDYDLDILVNPSGEKRLLDQEEYDLHAVKYGYPAEVKAAIHAGLTKLQQRIDAKAAPFQDGPVMYYYEQYKARSLPGESL